MSNNKSWQEMTDEERDILYKQVSSEHQRQLFDLIARWNVTGVLLPKQNASDIKDGLLDLRPREVFVKIRTTMGPIKVYLRSESHLCTPFQMDLYTLRYTSMSEYAHAHPKKFDPIESFISTLSRDIRAMLTFIGVDYTTLKCGKKYGMTEAIIELYDYLYDFYLSKDGSLCTHSLKDLSSKEANKIYSLLLNAFNSVPPLKDRRHPFRADGLLNLDIQEVNRRYNMLSNFCKETNIKPLHGYEEILPSVEAILYNIEQESSVVGAEWRALTDADRNYIKICLNKKYSQLFNDFSNYTHNIIAETYKNRTTTPKSVQAPLGSYWLQKQK